MKIAFLCVYQKSYLIFNEITKRASGELFLKNRWITIVGYEEVIIQ